MFGKKKALSIEYDKENEIPVLKCSICNGEQMAGFQNLHTGGFREIAFIRSPHDLEEFKERCGVTELKKVY